MSIITGDEKALTSAPGIGKKIAQRVILELKDKLAKGQTAAAGRATAAAASPLFRRTRPARLRRRWRCWVIPARRSTLPCAASIWMKLTLEEIIRTALRGLAVHVKWRGKT